MQQSAVWAYSDRGPNALGKAASDPARKCRDSPMNSPHPQAAHLVARAPIGIIDADVRGLAMLLLRVIAGSPDIICPKTKWTEGWPRFSPATLPAIVG